MLRGKRTLIVLLVVLALLAAAALSARWLLRPDNLARVITGWVERELGAELTLAQSPGVRLVPQLQLGLDGVRLQRDGTLLASANELRVALPWSTLWAGGLTMESLIIRQPVIAWPQLTTLLSELSDPDAQSPVPGVPDIAVGVRIEDGVLYSDDQADDWRIDRISMVTTPLHDGDVFHLDAGARIRGAQSRTLSLSLRARPAGSRDGLTLEDIATRIVISPENLPLSEGMTIQLDGTLRIGTRGLSHIDMAGQLPGWPDWLPDLLGFQADAAIALALQLAEGNDMVALSLTQGERSVQARVDVRDIGVAFALIDRPLAALGAQRSEWRIDAIRYGGVTIEGLELDIGPVSTEPEPLPAAANDETVDDSAPGG